MTTTVTVTAPSPTILIDIVEAALTAPMSALSGVGLDTGRSALIAPRATIASSGVPGAIGTVELTAPMSAVESELVSIVLDAAAATLTSEGVSGTVATVAVKPKLFIVSAVGINQIVQEATLIPKAPVLTSISLTGTSGSAALTPRMSVVVGDAAGGQETAVTLIAPAPILTAIVATGSITTATLTAPRPVIDAAVAQALSNFITWCMNVEAPTVTNYTNFNFHSLVKLGDTYLGADTTGFYSLAGDDDAGTAIDATLRFGFTDFNSPQLKRVPAVYLGGRFAGGVNLLVKTDGEASELSYNLDPVETNLDTHLIKLGRGLRAGRWQFGLTNVLGSDFELDTIDIAEQILSRRVG